MNPVRKIGHMICIPNQSMFTRRLDTERWVHSEERPKTYGKSFSICCNMLGNQYLRTATRPKSINAEIASWLLNTWPFLRASSLRLGVAGYFFSLTASTPDKVLRPKPCSNQRGTIWLLQKRESRGTK